MTTNSEKATTQDGAYDALMRELMGSGWNPKAGARSGQDATRTLAETAMKELGEGMAQASPYEKAVLVAVLAPALAQALAPILAEALAPALVKALSEMAAAQKTDQQSASSEGSSQQG